MGVELLNAVWMPIAMFAAPTVRVPRTAAGWPVSWPTASAMNAAPPSWRVATTRTPTAGSASSSSRKLSPGTVKAQRTPAAAITSAMNRPTVRSERWTMRRLECEADDREDQAQDDDHRDDGHDQPNGSVRADHR